MNCQEIRSLSGPYLDSELEAKTSLEIHEHLANCPECARFFATDAKLNTQLNARLSQGEATPHLWKTVEERVRGTVMAEPAPAKTHTARSTQNAERWWRAWLWPSPRFYAGLAAVWAVMLAVRWFDVDTAVTASHPTPPLPPETERILAEQRRELAEMLGFIGTAPEASAPKRKTSPPQGRLRRSDVAPGHATGVLASPELYRV